MEYYIGRIVLISLISLRRLLRQRGFVSFRLLFLATTQRVSRCSLPSLRGRGWGEGHFYVFYYLCHYDFCPLCHSGFCLFVTLSFTYSAPYVFMSLCLPFLCYYVFYILSPLCLYVILASVHYVHSGFINVKYFYKLPILSVTCEWQVGQYPPFLSRTFREKFVSINETIVYKIKQRRQNSENHKFIYVRRTGKEIKERKIRYKKKEFVYIFHNKG